MTSMVTERTMTRRNDVSVKLDAEVARKARIVAEFEGKPFAAYLSELLEPILDRELEKHAGLILKPKKAKGNPEKP